jgi:hypothetical protein
MEAHIDSQRLKNVTADDVRKWVSDDKSESQSKSKTAADRWIK